MDFFDYFEGQHIGFKLLETISPGLVSGINFFQSPEIIVGFFTTRAPSAKYVLAKTTLLCVVLFSQAALKLRLL